MLPNRCSMPLNYNSDFRPLRNVQRIPTLTAVIEWHRYRAIIPLMAVSNRFIGMSTASICAAISRLIVPLIYNLSRGDALALMGVGQRYLTRSVRRLFTFSFAVYVSYCIASHTVAVHKCEDVHIKINLCLILFNHLNSYPRTIILH